MNGNERTRMDEAIESIAELERRADAEVGLHQRRIERATAQIGRPRTVYLILIFVLGWIALNVGLGVTGGRPFDPPPFFWLQGIVSLSALLMTILILTTENRTTQHDLRRDRLDLQINLLTERKVAKVIEMVEALRRDSPTIPDRHDPEAAEMRRATDPHAVAEALEQRTEVLEGDGSA